MLFMSLLTGKKAAFMGRGVSIVTTVVILILEQSRMQRRKFNKNFFVDSKLSYIESGKLSWFCIIWMRGRTGRAS